MSTKPPLARSPLAKGGFVSLGGNVCLESSKHHTLSTRKKNMEKENVMSDLKNLEILPFDEFWAKDPAPGTVYFEFGSSSMTLVGYEIDPEVDDPDNAVLVQVGSSTKSDEPELYAVAKWGSWDTPENQKIRKLQQEARTLMDTPVSA